MLGLSKIVAQVSLRPAVAADREHAYLVKRAAFREYAEKVWGWDEAEQRRLHDRRFDGQEFRIVEASGEDVGVVALLVTKEAVKLNQLFLLPECQGRGIGRECMLLLMQEARQRGLPIRLQVLKVNPRGRAFYERLEFAVIGESETHHEMSWMPVEQG